MSTENLYEYIKGEFKAINRVKQQPVADDADTWFRDENQVKLAGYNIEIWDAVTAGTQLTLGTDYVLALRDEAISGNEGFDVYAGYSIINAIYQGVDLYLTANIVGGYTSRPYRPTFTTVTENTTLNPSSMDDSIIADSTAGGFTITIGTPEYDNQRVAVICSGDNLVEISGPGLDDESYSNLALQYVGIGGIWLQLGGAGGGGGGNLSVGNFVWDPSTGAVPSDKLVADGSIYDIANYPALFARYGTLYGGDGITTFGVPDMQGITPGAFGTQDINGRTKGDATAIGGVREDQFQGHNHDSSGATSFSGGSGGFAVGTGVSTVTARVFGAAPDGINGDPRDGEYTRATELVGRWLIQAFDTVQEVPGDPSLIPAWVEEYSNPTPQTTIVEYVDNDWGGGLFYFGVSYIFLTDEVRTNGIMAVEIDGIDRTATLNANGSSSVIVKYYGATNEFRAFAIGTDFTSVSMVAIYKWDNVASGTLNPPVDGWETVFNDPGNTADVVNQWGTGEYSVYVSGFAAGSDLPSKITVEDISVDTRTASVSTGSNSASYVYIRHTNGVFKITSDGSFASGNITKIKKFNSLVNVIHTDANGIIQDEEINGQWVTRWAGGRMEISIKEERTGIACDVASGSLFRNSSGLSPILFTFEVPFVGDETVVTGGIYNGDGVTVSSMLVSATDTVASFLMWRTASTASATGSLSAKATGRWK